MKKTNPTSTLRTERHFLAAANLRAVTGQQAQAGVVVAAAVVPVAAAAVDLAPAATKLNPRNIKGHSL
ncbi:MAG TPA: hypothetical protein VIM62_09570 [Acidobacteriaceae bacterium]